MSDARLNDSSHGEDWQAQYDSIFMDKRELEEKRRWKPEL